MKTIHRVILANALLASFLSVQPLARAQIAGAPPEATRMPPRRHGPARIHGFRPDNTVESDNWSGYAITGSSFTEVRGSWIVPAVNCGVTPGTRSAPTASSFWVGLDGYTSTTVEQIGTDSDCDGRIPVYYAWYEFYPANVVEIPSLAVSPGDKISAQVSYSGSEFTVTITNVTTGESYSTTGTVEGAERSSAEWIAEAPCCTRSGGPLPLSDFGTVEFGIDYTSVSDTDLATDSSMPLVPISVFGAGVVQIDMESSKVAEAGSVTAMPAAGIVRGGGPVQSGGCGSSVTAMPASNVRRGVNTMSPGVKDPESSKGPAANTSGLSADGTSFTIKWQSQGSGVGATGGVTAALGLGVSDH